MKDRRGWFNESQRHALSTKGIKSSRKTSLSKPKYSIDNRPKRSFVCFRNDTTGMPYYDRIIKDPEYYEIEKGKQFKIIEISPEEFFKATAIGWGDISTWKQDMKEVSLLKNSMKYRRMMESGTKFDMPTLEYGVFGQTSQAFEEYGVKYHFENDPIWVEHEGRHRALAAATLCDRIPVMIVYPSDRKDLERVKKLMPDEIKLILLMNETINMGGIPYKVRQKN